MRHLISSRLISKKPPVVPLRLHQKSLSFKSAGAYLSSIKTKLFPPESEVKQQPTALPVTAYVELPSDRLTTVPEVISKKSLMLRKTALDKPYLDFIYAGGSFNSIKGFKYLGNSLGLFALFYAPSIYFYGKAPELGTLLVLVCGLIPSFYSHYLTRSYVRTIHLHTPLQGNKLLGPDQLVTFEVMGFLGRPVRIAARVGDIKPFNRKFNPANFQAARTIMPDGEVRFGPSAQFFIEEKPFRSSPIGLQLWAFWSKSKC